MIEKTYTIITETGIHARPATVLVTAVTPFKAEVTLAYKEKKVNLKSIMGVMSLGIPQGASITIAADGEDAEALLAAIDHVMQKEGLAQ